MKTTTETVQQLDPKKVHISTLNTRQPTEADVAELITSLKATGQITPAIVRPHPKKKGHYELAAGARRKVACQAAGLQLQAIVRSIPGAEFEDMILIDNLQRVDPDPMQEAELIRRRMAAGAEPSEIAARYGKSDTWLKRRMKLVSLTEAAREAWLPGGNMEHFTTEMMEYVGTMAAELQDDFAGHYNNCRRATSLASLLELFRSQSKDLKDVPWLHDPASFVTGCGPGCDTDTSAGLFPDPDHPCGQCVNTTCFRKRHKLFWESKIRTLLGDKKISDFILIHSKGYAHTIYFDDRELRCLDRWDFAAKYTKLKKAAPDSHLGIDIADENNPVICHLKLKEKNGSKATGSTALPGKSESREDKLTGRRLAALNQLLDNKIQDAPIPPGVSMLRLAAAFGMNSQRNFHYSVATTAPWQSLDSPDLVPSFDISAKPVTPELAIWTTIRPILRSRISYTTNRDLLQDFRQYEMKRIACLVGFDYETEWRKVCVDDVKVPKSWGPGIDPITLQPLTPAKPAADRASKPEKKPLRKGSAKAAKKTVKMKLAKK